MKKFYMVFTVLLISMSMAFVGCNSPLANEILDNLLGGDGDNIVSDFLKGNTAELAVDFATTTKTIEHECEGGYWTESEWVETAEGYWTEAQYEMVDDVYGWVDGPQVYEIITPAYDEWVPNMVYYPAVDGYFTDTIVDYLPGDPEVWGYAGPVNVTPISYKKNEIGANKSVTHDLLANGVKVGSIMIERKNSTLYITNYGLFSEVNPESVLTVKASVDGASPVVLNPGTQSFSKENGSIDITATFDEWKVIIDEGDPVPVYEWIDAVPEMWVDEGEYVTIDAVYGWVDGPQVWEVIIPAHEVLISEPEFIEAEGYWTTPEWIEDCDCVTSEPVLDQVLPLMLDLGVAEVQLGTVTVTAIPNGETWSLKVEYQVNEDYADLLGYGTINSVIDYMDAQYTVDLDENLAGIGDIGYELETTAKIITSITVEE